MSQKMFNHRAFGFAGRKKGMALALPLLAVIWFYAPEARAAIAVLDTAAATYQSGGATVTKSFTVSAGSKVLVVQLLTKTTQGAASVTWNGTSMNLAINQPAAATTYRDAAIYYLFNPASGGPFFIVATGASGTTDYWIDALTLSGVDTAVAPLTGGVDAGSLTTASVTINSVAASSFAVAAGALNINAGGTTTGFTGTGGSPTTYFSNFQVGAVTLANGGYVSGLAAGSDTFTDQVNANNSNKFPFAVAVFTPSAAAVTYTWTGGTGADTLWTNSANWDANGVPVSGAANDVVFPPVTFQTVTAIPAITLKKITFTGAAGGYNLNQNGSNAITLAGGASAILSSATSGTNTIACQIAFSTAAPTITATASGTLTFTSTALIDNGTLNLTLAANGPVNIAGVISNSGKLLVTGSNITTISSSCTFTGRLDVIGGGMLMAGAGFGLTAAEMRVGDSVNGAGTFDLNGQSVTVQALSGTHASAIIDNKSGAGTYTLTHGANNFNTSYAGVIKNTSGSTATTKLGTGTFGISNANINSGATNINKGVVQILSGGSLANSSVVLANDATVKLDMNTFSTTIGSLAGGGGAGGIVDNVLGGGTPTLTMGGDNNPTTFTGVIKNTTGTLAIIKTGTGTLTLSGANIYGGATSIKNGAIQISAGSDRLPTGTTVTLGDTGTTGKLILGDGTANARNQTLAGLLTTGLGGSVVGGSTVVSTLTLNVGSGDVSLSATLGGGGSNENLLGLTKTGANKLTITGANTYSGNTTVSSSSTLALGNDSALGVGGTLIITSNGATIQSSGGVRTLANAITLGNAVSSTQTILGGSDNLTFNGNVTLVYYGANSTQSITIPNAGTVVTFNGNIGQSSSSVGFGIYGNGTCALTGTNTFNGFGGLSVGLLDTPGGTLKCQLGSDGVLGTNVGFNLGGCTLEAINGNRNLATASFGMNGDVTFTGSNNMTVKGDITVGNTPAGTSGRTLTIDGPGVLTVTSCSALGNNNGYLFKAGAGTLSFTSDRNCNPGSLNNLIVNAGTLQLAPTLVLPDGPRGGALTTTSITVNSPGILDIAGAAGTDGAILSLAGNGSVTIGADSTLSINGYDTTFSGPISGAGSLLIGNDRLIHTTGIAIDGTQTGQQGGQFYSIGSQVLSGVSSYTGTTTVNVISAALVLAGDTGRLYNGTLGTSGITLSNGGSLVIDKTGTANPDRINDGATLTMSGGGSSVTITAPAGVDRTETVGAISFSGGLNLIRLTPNGSGKSILTGSSFAFTSGMVEFIRNTGGGSALAHFIATTPPGSVPAAVTVNGSSATYNSGLASDGVTDGLTTASTAVDFLSANPTDWNTASTWVQNQVPTANSTVRIIHAVTMAASPAAAPAIVIFGPGGSLSSGSQPTLSVGTSGSFGRIAVEDGVSASIPGSGGNTGVKLNFGANPAVFDTIGSSTFTSSVAGDSENGVTSTAGLTKLGAGTLQLFGDNWNSLVSVPITISAGVLEVSNATKQALGRTGNSIVLDGATFKMTGSLSLNGGGTDYPMVLESNGGTLYAPDSDVTTNIISGSGGLTKTGSFKVAVSNNLGGAVAATYSGPTYVTQGTLEFGQNITFSDLVSVSDGATLTFDGACTFNGGPNGGVLLGDATINLGNGAYITTLNTDLTYTGSAQGNIIHGSPFSWGGTRIFNTVQSSGTLYCEGFLKPALNNNSKSLTQILTKTGPGTMKYWNGSCYMNGGLNVNGGKYQGKLGDANNHVMLPVSVSNATLDVINLGNNQQDIGTLTLNNGIVTDSSGASIKINTEGSAGTTAISSSGTSSISAIVWFYTSPRNINVSSGTLTWSGYNTDSIASLTKDGAGALALTHTVQTYNISTMTVTAGTLSGIGTLSGNITVSAGGTLSPSLFTPPYNLTNGNNTFSFTDSTSVFSVPLDNASNSAGMLTVNHPSNGNIGLNNATLTVTGFVNGSGTYTILKNNNNRTYTGTFNGLGQGATVTSTGGTTFTISYTGGAGGKDVILTSALLPLIWTGNASNSWDTTVRLPGPTNWKRGGVPADFQAGNDVIFDSSDSVGNISVVAGGVASGSMTVSGGNSYSFSGGAIGGSGALTMNGGGALTLSNANTYSGGTILNSGTLALDASSTPLSGAVTSGPVGTGTLTLSGGIIQSNTAARAIGNALSFGGSFTVGGSLNLTLNGNGTLTGNRTITVTNAAVTAAFNGNIGQDVSGRQLNKSGSGILLLSGANTFSNANFNAGAPGTIMLGASSTGAAGAVTSGPLGTGQLTVPNGSVTVATLASNGSWTVNNDLLITGSGATASALIVDTAGFPLSLGGGINNGAAILNKVGAGTLTLGGNSTNFKGTLNINVGTLKVGNAGALGPAPGSGTGAGFSDVTLSGTAMLDLGGFNAFVGSLSGVAGTFVDNSVAGGPYTLSVGPSPLNTTFAGIIKNTSGTVALKKLGGGILTLSGANDYDGVTTLAYNTADPSGGLNIQNNTALGKPAGGAVDVGYRTQLQIQGNITVGAKALTLHLNDETTPGPATGPAVLRSMSGNNTWGGTVTLGDTSPNVMTIQTDAGTLTFNAATSFIISPSLPFSNYAMAVQGDGDTVISGVITSGSGGMTLTKSGTGTLTLSGANTYNNATTINGGTVKLTGASASLKTSAVNFNGGTLLIDGTVTSSPIFTLAAHPNLTFNGGVFDWTIPTGVSRTETVVLISLLSGSNTIRLTSNGANQATLTSSSSFSRSAGAVLAFATGSFNPPTGAKLFAGSSAQSVPYATVNGLPARYDTTDGLVVDAANDTYTSKADADWSQNTTWKLNHLGTITDPAPTPPTANSNVVVQNAVTRNSADATSINSLRFSAQAGAGATGLSGANVLNFGASSTGILVDSSIGANVAVSAPISFGANDGYITNFGTSSNTLTLSSTLTGTSANTLTTSGTGTIALSADNSGTLGPASGTGTIYVDAGTLSFSAENQLGKTGTGQTNLTLNGGALGATGSSAFSTARVITLGASGGTINVTNTDTTTGLTLSTAFTANANSITKTGPGILTFTADNSSRSGATNINAGTLMANNLTSSNGSNASPTVINSGGTLSNTVTNGKMRGLIIVNSGGTIQCGNAGGVLNLQPGTAGSPITEGVIFNSGSALRFYIGANLATYSTLSTITGGRQIYNAGTLLDVIAISTVANGAYHVAKFFTSPDPSLPSNFVLRSIPSGKTVSISIPQPADTDLILTIADGATASKYLVSSNNYTPAVDGSNPALPLTITAQLADNLGNSISEAGRVVTWTFTGAGGAVTGTTSQSTSTTNSSGIATASFSISTVAPVTYTVTATDTASLTGTTPNIISQAAAAQKAVVVLPGQSFVAGMGVTGSPTPRTAGVPFSITVKAIDQYNNVNTNVGSAVAVTTSDPNDTEPSSPANFNSGSATFSITNVTASPPLHSISPAGTALTNVTSSTYTVIANIAAKLAFTTSPSGSNTAGAPFGAQPVVTLQDAYGNTVTGVAQDVTLAIQNNPPGNGALSGTTTLALNTITGQAVFSGLSINKTGMGYTLTAKGNTFSTSFGTVISGAFDITPGTAAKFQITGSGTQTAGQSNTITITALDAFGNTATGYSGDHDLIFSGANASTNPVTSPTVADKNVIDQSFGSTTTLTFTAGAASSAMKLYKAETAVIAATAGVVTTTGADQLTVVVSNTGALAKFVLSLASPQSNTAPFTGANTLTAQDAYGNTVTGFNASSDNVTITANSPLTGTVSGLGSGSNSMLNQSGDFASGAANLTNLGMIYTGNTNTGTFTATSGSGKTGTSGPVTINPAPATKFQITGAGTQAAGQTNTITITALDASGNTASGYTGDHALTFSGANASASPVTSPTVADKNSVDRAFGVSTTLTFTSGIAMAAMKLYKVETAVIVATSGALTTSGADRLTVIVTPGTAAMLVFTTAPAGATAGAPFGTQPVVKTQDSFGNLSTVGLASNLTLTLAQTAGTGSLLPAGPHTIDIGTSAFNGVADFGNPSQLLEFDVSGSKTLQATVTGGVLTPASATFTVSPAAASQLVFSTQPGGAKAGNAFLQQPVVKTQDQYGNDSTVGLPSTLTLTLTLQSGAGALLPAGAHTIDIGASAGNGVADFGNPSQLLEIDVTGIKQLHAAAGSFMADSAPFLVTAGTPVTLAYFTQPGPLNGSTGGVPFVQQPVVELRDAFGNTATGSAQVVSLTIKANTGTAGATLSGATSRAVDTLTGQAVFSGLSIDKVGLNYQLRANGDTVVVAGPNSGIDSDPFNIAAGPPARMIFVSQPSGGAAGVPWPTQPSVAIQDAGGNNVNATTAVSLAIDIGAGTGAVLSGTATQNAVAGLASFSDLSIQKSGTYSLIASASGLSPADSSTFDIRPNGVARLVVSGFPSPAVSGVPGSVTVTAVDAFGNVAPNFADRVHISSTDDHASQLNGALPPDYLFTTGVGPGFDNGRHTFSSTALTPTSKPSGGVYLFIPGFASIIATDIDAPTIKGSQTKINVIRITSDLIVQTGMNKPFSYQIVAKGAPGTVFTSYAAGPDILNSLSSETLSSYGLAFDNIQSITGTPRTRAGSLLVNVTASGTGPGTLGIVPLSVSATLEINIARIPPNKLAVASNVTVLDNPTIAGTQVSFSVSAHDGDRTNPDLISELWNFGDGTTAYGPLVFHTYDYPGEYGVNLILNDGTNTIKVSLLVAVATADGFIITKAQLVFNFVAPTLHDSMVLTGFLPVPVGDTWTGKTVGLEIGGFKQDFVLNSKGVNLFVTNMHFNLLKLSRTGAFVSSPTQFTVKVARNSLFALFSAAILAGYPPTVPPSSTVFTNSNIPATAPVHVTTPIKIIWNKTGAAPGINISSFGVNYSATQGTVGKGIKK